MFITDSVFTMECNRISGTSMRKYDDEEIARLTEKTKAAVKESSRLMQKKGLEAFPSRNMEHYDDYLVGRTQGEWGSTSLTGGALFNHKANFFERTAQAYLDSPSVIDNFTKTGKRSQSSEISLFAYEAMDYFLPSDSSSDRMSWIQLRDQMKQVVQELAGQMASGSGSDLSKVQTKLTVGGVDFTAQEFSQTIEALMKISDPLQKRSGTLDLKQFARLGIATSQVNRYATENLSEEQAKLVAGAYGRHVNNHIQDADSYGLTLEEKMKKTGVTSLDPHYDPFYATSPDRKSGGTIRETAYKLFASLDVSSNRAFKQSFEQTLRQYSDLLKGANEHWFPTPNEYQDAMATFYRIQIQPNGAIDINMPIDRYA